MASEFTFPLEKALEFVGDNSNYQKRRLLWISLMLLSFSVLNSYLPLTFTAGQTTLFFFASAAGQLVCPMYFGIPMLTQIMCLTSLFAVLVVGRVVFLETLVFAALGFFGRGIFVSSSIYINEIGGERWRAVSFMILFMVWGSAPFALALVKMLKLGDTLGLFIIVTLPHAYVMFRMRKHWHNSPVYYCEKKADFENAKQVLNEMAKENGRAAFNYKLEGEEKILTIEHKKYGYADLFTLNSLKVMTIPLCILWFYREFIYYGSFMILPYLGAEQSKNLILLSVSETVAALMSIPVILRVKRINSFFGMTCFILVACLLVSFFDIPEECFPSGQSCFQKFIYRSSAMVIRFSISLIGSILLNYTVQLFPAAVRGLGFGVCLAAGSLGTVAMPCFVEFLVAVGWSPFLCFSVVSGVTVYFIPRLAQTQGKMTSKRVSQMENADSPILHIDLSRL